MAAAARRLPEAPAIVGAKKAGATVTVACKIPNGLVLQLQRQRSQREQTLGGERTVNVWDKVGERIIVAGPAYPNGQTPKGFKRRPDDASGFALTHGVPADFWTEWVEQNKDADYVKSGMIFAHHDVDDVRAQGQDFEKHESGFQPLNPDGDPRAPRPIGQGVTAIEKAVVGPE